jgi:hypothetical protein
MLRDPVKLTLIQKSKERTAMAKLYDVEIYFAKLGKPNGKFNKENPTWELQIRTTDKEKKKEWEAIGLTVKAIVPDDGDTYFRANLKKKSIKSDGTPNEPVKLIDGKLRPIDPNTIGNGSIGNIRVFEYEYKDPMGVTKKGFTLMTVQLTKHIVYTPRISEDDFGETEYEREFSSNETDDDVF